MLKDQSQFAQAGDTVHYSPAVTFMQLFSCSYSHAVAIL